MIAYVAAANAAVLKTPNMPTSLMKLRGGMAFGPVDADLVNGVLKVAAAVTVAGAVTEKYAGMDSTMVTKTFKGDVWTTNVIIALVTGVASTAVYSVGASSFDSSKVASALWLVSVLMKVKDSGFDVSSIMNDPVETVVALLTTLFAWA